MNKVNLLAILAIMLTSTSATAFNDNTDAETSAIPALSNNELYLSVPFDIADSNAGRVSPVMQRIETKVDISKSLEVAYGAIKDNQPEPMEDDDSGCDS